MYCLEISLHQLKLAWLALEFPHSFHMYTPVIAYLTGIISSHIHLSLSNYSSQHHARQFIFLLTVLLLPWYLNSRDLKTKMKFKLLLLVENINWIISFNIQYTKIIDQNLILDCPSLVWVHISQNKILITIN